MDISKSIIKLPQAVKELSSDYTGYVVISDIDKTYLATQIESIGGLLKTAFETAESKDNIPGFSIILRALRRGGGVTPQKNPLFFVSASPPQMRQTLLSKMQFDGIEHNGIVFKDQLEHVRNRAFKKLREQIGYKLEALLALWANIPNGAKLVLFGDDSESDPAIYSLFADVLAGRARGQKLDELLAYLGVFPEERRRIVRLSDEIEGEFDPIELIFINLVSGSNPSFYSKFGPQLFATENSMQVALTLFERGLIRERAVRSVGRDLLLHYDYSPQRILESLKSGAFRGLYGMETLKRLWPQMAAVHIVPRPEDEDLDNNQVTSVTRLSRHRWDLSENSDLRSLKIRYGDEPQY